MQFKPWRRHGFKRLLKCELIGQLLNHVVLLGYCFTRNHKCDHFKL